MEATGVCWRNTESNPNPSSEFVYVMSERFRIPIFRIPYIRRLKFKDMKNASSVRFNETLSKFSTKVSSDNAHLFYKTQL